MNTPWGKAEKIENRDIKLGQIYHYAVYKDYAGQRRKLVMLKGLPGKPTEKRKTTKKSTVINNEKLENNIIRAKSKVMEYGLCNSWDYFVTLTIDPEKHDRADLKVYYKKLSQFLRDYRKKHNCNIQYVLIPELHKDKINWHMHGFISGIPQSQIKKQSNGYLTWADYQNKFGYISMDRLRNKSKAASYITKYITKELSFAVTERNAKLYYCSRGLKTAEVLASGAFHDRNPSEKDYKNDWAVVRWYDDNFPDLQKDFLGKEKSP